MPSVLQNRNGRRWLQFSWFIRRSFSKGKCRLLCNAFPWCVPQLHAQLMLCEAEFVLDDVPFRILFICLCSSRCTCLSVRRECRSPHIRRPWDSDRTGVGTKCSWGSPYTWFCSGSVCLLALFSTAWWEHTINMIIFWPLRILHAGIWSDQFSRVLMWLPM